MQFEVDRANFHETRVVETPGESGTAYHSLLDGRAEPHIGYVVSMHGDSLS